MRDFIPICGYNQLKIKSIKFDCNSYFLSIKTKPTPEWTIIPKYMSISGVTVSLTVQLKSPKTSLHVITNGNWRVGNLNVAVSADYKKSSGITHIIARPYPGTSLRSFVRSITGLSLPVSSYKINFKFEGNVHANGATFLQLSSDKGTNKFYSIYKKLNKKSVPVKAIAVEVKKFRLSTLLRRLIKQDFSNTPFFGRLVVPDLGLIYSTGRMRINGTKVFKNSPLLLTTRSIISKGLSAFIRVPFHHEPLIAKYQNRVLVITTPHRNLRLDILLQYLLSGGGNWRVSLPFPQLKQIFRLHIEILNVSRNSVTAIVAFPGPIVFFESFLKVSNVKAKIHVFNRKPRVSVEITGKIHLSGATFKTKLAQNRRKKYVLTAIGDRLDINRVMQTFHAAVLPRAIHRLLRNIPFLKVTILRPRISYTFGARPLQIHIGGNPVIHGYRIVNVDSVLVKIHGKILAILGFELGSINLADMLTNVTGFNFRRFQLLNQKTQKITITISPITSRRVHFSVRGLASIPIKKGISLRASIKFPSDCRSDKFCKFAGRLVGHKTVLSLQATIQSTTFYSITASLHKLRLGRGLTFIKAGLEIVGGTSSRIGLDGEVKLNKPDLLFAARIFVGTKSLTLQLSMTNCWYRAFGAEWLDICNLLGVIDFAPPTGITDLAFGAQIHLGYKSTSHQIKAKGYIGVSIINPIENYYYVKFNRITMGSLLKAFKISTKLPRPLAESGFPHGFLSSFSVLGKEFPQVRVSIPSGYRLKGTLNILGLQGSVDITIGLPKLIDINVALPPIRIGRILAMYASPSNSRRGPYLKVKVQSIPRFLVHIEARGYLKVLGISIETRLKITNTQYEYFIRGRILHLFEASMHITARYGSIWNAHFRVRGEFKLDLFRGIKRIVTNRFRAFSNVAKHVVQKFSNLLKKAKQAFHRGWKKLKHIGRGLFIARLMELCSDETCEEAVTQGKSTYFSFNMAKWVYFTIICVISFRIFRKIGGKY